MKKILMLFLCLFSTAAFASGIASNSASAPCTNNTLETYSGNSNLAADWQPNTINLSWYNEDEKLTVQQSAQSCVYDGTLSIPATPPTRTGYTFAGWKVRIPGIYTELEYLESTEFGPYIDTGINFNSNYTYEIDYSRNGRTNTIMGARNNCSYSEKGNFSITYCSNTCLYSSTSYGAISADFSDTEFGVKHKVKYQQSTRTLTFDGTDYWFSEWITNIEIPHNVYLFAIHCPSSAAGSIDKYVRIYSYSVKNSADALIKNLVPVRRNSDNVVGMYDTVTQTFFTNAGTGTFIAGPAVQ